MANTQRASVIITCNASEAKKALDEIKTHAAQLRQQYNSLAKQYDKIVAEQGKNSKAAKDLNRELKRLETTQRVLEKAIKVNEQELGDLGKIMNNLAGSTTRQLRSALSRLKREMENTSGNEIAKLRQIRSQMKAIEAQIERNTGAARRHGGAWQTSLRNIGTYIGMFAGLHQVIARVGQAIRGNLDMSDQLSQIRMVSGLAEKKVFELSDALKGLDTRSNLSELQSIAYEGSKLGMGKYGVEGLKGFTEAANELNVALKEQLGEGTLTDMSKMVENMGLIKSMGIEKALKATGSAMFMLSSSSTATAGNIVEFTKRLYALAKNAGITTDQLLALGSASDSFGLMPEVAATAMNKVITAIQKQPRTVEKAVGLTPGTINNLYKTGNVMEALVQIFQKMHDMGNMNAMAPIFKDLGSDGARLNTVVVSMAENVDTLRSHLGISKQAFNEASAVTQEYNLRQETANGILQRANNLWNKAFVNKDGTLQVKEMAQAWYDFSKSATEGGLIITELKVAFESLLLTARALIYALPFLINGLLAIGAVKSFRIIRDSVVSLYNVLIASKAAKVVADTAETVSTNANTAAQGANTAATGANATAKGIQTVAERTATAATETNTAAVNANNAAMRANVIAVVISLLITLGSILYQHFRRARESAEAQEGFNMSMEKFNSLTAQGTTNAKALVEAIKNANAGSRERQALIDTFNAKYGQYIDSLITETTTAEGLATAYDKVVTALRKKIAMELRNEDVEKHVKPAMGWYQTRLFNYGEAAEKNGDVVHNQAWLDAFIEDQAKAGNGKYNIIAAISRALGVRNVYNELSGDLRSDGADELTKYYQQVIPKGAKYFDADKGQGVEYSGYQKRAAQALLAGLAVYQYFGVRSRENDINRKWGNKGLADPDAVTTNNSDLTNDAAQDKLNARLARQREAAEKKRIAAAKRALNEEMQRAKADATAIISNIDAYYNLQSKALDEMGPGGKNERYTREEITALQAELRRRQLRALAQARYAIAGKSNDFENIRTNEMGNGRDRFDTSDRSADLLTQIRGVDLSKAYASLAKFNGLEAVYGINAGSILDEINRNATENEKQIAELQQKQAKAVQETIDSADDFGKLRREIFDRMVTQGLNIVPFTRAARQVFPNETAGGTNYASASGVPLGPGERDGGSLKEVQVRGYRVTSAHPAEDMLNAVQRMGYRPYVGDVSTDRNMYTWLRGFTSNYQSDEKGNPILADWAKSLPDIADWMRELNDLKVDPELGFPDDKELKEVLDPIREKVQLFYLDMIDYADNYYQQRKKYYEEQKKIVDEMWNRSVEKQTLDNEARGLKQTGRQEAIYGRPQNDWQPFGFANTLRSDDNELAQNRNSLAQAQAQYAIARQKNADPTFLKQYLDKIDEAQSQLEQTIASRVNDRMTELQQWTDPIEQMGTAMGEAFAQMSDDAQKGRDAVKAALRDMVKAYAQSTVNIIKELMTRQVKEKLIRKTTAKDSENSNDSMLSAQKVFSSGMGAVTQQMSADMTKATMKQKADNTEAVVDNAKTDTEGGIVSGAAKIIAKLGWWGIPLVAVITALLNGLLAAFLSKIGKGGGSESSAPNTKLKTGMLTYDSGNVQEYKGLIDGRSYPVVGNDGRVYAATSVPEAVTGIVNSPIATMINGQPSLVGERGPEMVIGRETTAAMMINRPDLLREIVRYDKYRSGASYRAYDSGNVQEVAGALPSPNEGVLSDTQTQEVLQSLTIAVASLTSRLQHPITAEMNLYGRNGAQDAIRKANEFMNRHR